jgi:zinc transport system permease protein
MMLLATVVGGAVNLAGLALSYGPDLPAGPTIILVAGALYVASALLVGYLARRRARRAAGEGDGGVD